MLKKHYRRQMPEEKRRRIERLPGVVVHERKHPEDRGFFRPAFQGGETMQITASELIDSDLDEQPEE